MRYLIALLIPPLGLLICGKPGQAVVNFLLIIVAVICALSVIAAPVGFWIAGATALHALLIAHNTYADERVQRLERLLIPHPTVAPMSPATVEPPSESAAVDWDEAYGPRKKSLLSWLA